MMSPFDLHCRIHGEQSQSKLVFYITSALGVFVFLAVVAGALLVTP